MALTDVLPAIESLSIAEKEELSRLLLRELSMALPNPLVDNSPVKPIERARYLFPDVADVDSLVNPKTVIAPEIEEDPELVEAVTQADELFRETFAKVPGPVRIEWDRVGRPSQPLIRLSLTDPYGYSSARDLPLELLSDDFRLPSAFFAVWRDVLEKSKFRRHNSGHDEEADNGDEY